MDSMDLHTALLERSLPAEPEYISVPGCELLNPASLTSRQDHFPLDLETIARMFRSGFVVLDQNGAILFASQQAGNILEAGCGIGVRNRCLFIERASIQRSLGEMIKRTVAAIVEGAPDSSTPAFLGVSDLSGAVRYALKVISAAHRGGQVEILLAIVDFLDSAGPSRATFAAIFRLSEREAELAELFSQGLRLEAISERMGIALNTARVHLRAVFLKTNCSSQLGLLRILTRLGG